MALGTTTYLKTAHRSGLGGGISIVTAEIATPTAAGQTSFTVSVKGAKVGDHVVLTPSTAAGAALTGVWAAVTADNVVTVSHANAALDGTQKFAMIVVMAR